MKKMGFLLSALGLGALTYALKRPAYDFENKVVLITGGSRGLGLALARVFAEEGAHLALLARDENELERAAGELRAKGTQVLTLPCDVRERQEVENAVKETVAHFGSLGVLVNNAGVIQAGPFAHMQEDDFRDALEVHLWGALYTVLAALPHLERTRKGTGGRTGGRIVNISSIGGKVAVPHLLPYAVSKFALVGLSEGLRAELAQAGVKVTTVCPGLLRTGSYPNVRLKGQHAQELAWFAVGDSLPLLTMSAPQAARKIVEACRRGKAQQILTLPARGAVLANALLPEVTAKLLSTTNRLLPGLNPVDGDDVKQGREVHSSWAPSLLTTLSDRAAKRHNQPPLSTSKARKEQ